MLSLCFNHVTTVASPFRCSVFHFLAKFSKICEIFFSCEKKAMKLSLLHKNVNTSSHKKDNLMALTAVFIVHSCMYRDLYGYYIYIYGCIYRELCVLNIWLYISRVICVLCIWL